MKRGRRAKIRAPMNLETALPSDPPGWSVAGVVDAPFASSFLLLDKGPPAPPTSRWGPARTALGLIPFPRAVDVWLARCEVLYELAVLALLLTYPALQKGGAWVSGGVRWSAAGSRLEPAGMTTGYGPACRAA